ncbi:MAG: hypothetical protein PHY25_03735 [Dehalococcoidales bacterium]|nr:hypothetical protein [Dehalococcoidales bacterium]
MRQRDEKGRFIKGNNANPNGRPPKAREQEFLNVTIAAVSCGDWIEIIQKAVSQAKKGDASARKFLADYLIGPPTVKTDLTTNGESINAIGVTGVDYRSAITNLAPGSMGNSAAPSESESAFDGETLG